MRRGRRTALASILAPIAVDLSGARIDAEAFERDHPDHVVVFKPRVVGPTVLDAVRAMNYFYTGRFDVEPQKQRFSVA